MHQSPGFRDPQHPDYACHLQRSLYGLKQAFAQHALRLGFQQSLTDSSLFVYRHGAEIAYFLLYVDDIILIA